LAVFSIRSRIGAVVTGVFWAQTRPSVKTAPGNASSAAASRARNLLLEEVIEINIKIRSRKPPPKKANCAFWCRTNFFANYAFHFEAPEKIRSPSLKFSITPPKKTVNIGKYP
jgi:hypothetical protein